MYKRQLYGCAKLMHVAISLGIMASDKDERLSEADEKLAIGAALAAWKPLEGAGHPPDKLASIIYRPLYEKEASKAITAQYAAHLLSTGEYGEGDDLFNRLPPYLQRALNHLTTATAPAPAPARGITTSATAAPTAVPLPGAAPAAPVAVSPAHAIAVPVPPSGGATKP